MHTHHTYITFCFQFCYSLFANISRSSSSLNLSQPPSLLPASRFHLLFFSEKNIHDSRRHLCILQLIMQPALQCCVIKKINLVYHIIGRRYLNALQQKTNFQAIWGICRIEDWFNLSMAFKTVLKLESSQFMPFFGLFFRSSVGGERVHYMSI